MNALFCAFDKKKFHRVSSCESANEIWHKLEVVYEGTNQVKESKISRYTRQYELFQMEQNESVYSMYTRFTDIVNTLGALGKKIIRSLPTEWRPKRTAIEEAKDLNILPIDDLIGPLISYEEDLATERGNEEKKKNIALKATKYESDGESEPDDEELAMLARRFRKFFKKTGDRRKFRNFKNQKEKKEVIICYECKKPDHIRSECPLLNKLKKKAMVATWDDSDEDSSDEEESQEVSNPTLMAIGDDDDLNEVSDPTYDELYDAFKEIHDELMKIGKKNACLKNKLLEFTNEKDAMQKCNESLNEKIKGLELENKTLHNRVALSNEKPSTSHEHLEPHVDDLKKENEMLKKKNIELNNVVLKFANGQKMLDNMLNSQKCVFDKGGLGYKPNLKQKYASLSGKFYAFVIVDDYSRYTWVLFLAKKDDAIDAFRIFCKKVQNEKGYSITCIRSDHGGEFENHAFENFCNDFGIEHQFSSPRTPQQNGVVERKNRSIQEMARTMLNENALPKYFWAEAVNTACYVLNRVLIRSHLNKTPYELWKDRKSNISYFKVFGCKCFILNTKDNLGKFDPKSDVGIFLGYSNSSKAYRVYNKRILVIEESMHVTFDESNPSSTEKRVVNDDADGELQEESSKENQENAPQENQEDRQEEQTNMEQQEVKVFYSNMDTEVSKYSNRIVINVEGVHIEFDVALLNSILGTPNEGLELYSTRAKIKDPWFSLKNAVRKICRRSGHADEVSRLDVTILDCILEERVLNIGYIILHHMLSTPSLVKRSLIYASIITRILEYFCVPITEPISLNSRELGDDSIANLGFYWRDDRWYKDLRNKKVTELAFTDHRFFNDVRPPNLLPDLSSPHLSRPPPSEGPSHSTSADSEDPLRQLLTKVDSLSERQEKLQSMLEAFQFQSISERERLLAQQQQLLNGQQQLFAALGFPPPSSSSHPPSP
ncbi:hypothetical protein KPL70_011720 [Citrus sinensis]|nr:hypothetical protein KPL70_011720 [Citrus sinensis]